MQERLERSELGRVVISAFLVVTLVVIVAFNFPYLYDSPLKRDLQKMGWRFVEATSVEQAWSVFAPNPRQTPIDFRVRVDYSDGTHGYWHIPHFTPLFGDYRSTRWRKWVEVVWDQNWASTTWQSTALWVARHEATNGKRPVRITFIRRWQNPWPPDAQRKEAPKWHEQRYYSVKIPARLLRGGSA